MTQPPRMDVTSVTIGAPDPRAVEDLDAAAAWAQQAGATQAAYQPQQRVRVMLDPAGQPFCLFLR